MAWQVKVLVVLAENKNKEGELKSRWEVTRPENDETGKHFAEGLQKTSYYMKNGELTRGYPQALTQWDLGWIRKNWSQIRAALDPAPPADAPASSLLAVAVAAAEVAPTDAEIEEIPF